MDDSVLIVAFDGLDYELIQQYDCRTFLDMNEFGRIDNHTSMSSIKTSELFASFITGTTYKNHGVTGLKRWEPDWIDRIESRLSGTWPFNKTNGLRKALWESIDRFNAVKRHHTEEDLQYETLFETVPASKALFVPGYNPSYFLMTGGGLSAIDYGASLDATAEVWEREYQWRRQRLWSAISEEYRLLMTHFHKPDIWHHLFAPDNTVRHEQPVRHLYRKMDQFAADILDRATDRYDTVLFMSDHGLPTADGHNRNAFYATNTETSFDTPHITDFHDWIIEQCGREAVAEEVAV